MQKKERGIWQRRFWEHTIRDETDYLNHINYVHHNPVKHGYVCYPCEWQYSSIHRYMKLGILSRPQTLFGDAYHQALLEV